MIMKKCLYYILNLTWGLPLTAVGALAAFGCLLIGRRPKRHGGCWYFNIGSDWGGLNLGLFFFTDQWDSRTVKNHEYGHSLQNALWGPLMIFVIAIPSVIRYWIHRIRTHYHKPNPPYDAIWFEGQATHWGNQTISQWKKI